MSERRLRFRAPSSETHVYQADIERIVAIAEARGFALSEPDALAAWEAYSECFAAGWMMLSEADDDVWRSVVSFLEEVPHD
jgi:hypothetical protein